MRVLFAAVAVVGLAACAADANVPGENAIGTVHDQAIQSNTSATEAARAAAAAAQRAQAAAERAEAAVMRLEQGYQQSLRK